MSHILIIDPSLTIRMDLKELFESHGHIATACESITCAKEALGTNGFEVVVLDASLLDDDGLSLVVELKGEAQSQQAATVILASDIGACERIRSRGVVVDDLVVKPYERDELSEKVDLLLREVSLQQRVAPRILVIDDSETFRHEFKGILQKAGYLVSGAASGEEGLKLAEVLPLDLIVVDQVLPGMHGNEVIRALKQEPRLRKIPCVLMTANDEKEGELNSLSAGSDAYISKGEDIAVVLARLAAICRSSSAQMAAKSEAKAPSGIKILTVDDSLTYVNALAGPLRAEGYFVATASSGEEALKQMANEIFDCVLLDLKMPGLSGTEVCRRIKTSLAWYDIPVIMLTGCDDRMSMIESFNAGADDYIAKTSDEEVVKARLKVQLRRKQFEVENRLMREQLHHKEVEAAEAKADKELAEARAKLLEGLEEKNRELRAFQIEVERARDEAESANRAKSAFLANMSHEIRTPLGAIMGFSELIVQTDPDTPEREYYLGTIRRNGLILTRLLDDLLDLSKVEAGRLDVEKIDVVLEDLLLDVESLLGHRAKDAGINFCIRIESGTPKAIRSDPTRLRQILINVIGNALKFTQRGGQVTVTMRSSGADRIALVIEDTGLGIADDQQSKIFEPFTQADSSTTRKYGGTGLGLTLSRRLAKALGGDLELRESNLGRGSVFIVTLETGVEPGMSTDNTTLAKTTKIETAIRCSLEGIKVLLVDDSEDNRMMISRFLAKEGADVDLAENGKSGVEMALSVDYDIILMDMQMPVLDGYSATRALREKGYLRPIVALTAHALKEERVKSLEWGCSAHLTKPVNLPHLISTVKQFASDSV